VADPKAASSSGGPFISTLREMEKDGHKVVAKLS
jgi:hypothetical protein